MATNEDTRESSQTLDNRSFNSGLQIYENLIYGYDGTNAVAIKVDNAGNIQTDNSGYTGTGDNGSVTLTLADTAYAIPTVAPANPYVMTVQNNSDSVIYVGYENTNASGLALQISADAQVELGAGQQIYAYCGSAGKALTYILKES